MAYACERCASTVNTVTNRWLAISLFDNPRVTRSTTCCSLGVNSPSAADRRPLTRLSSERARLTHPVHPHSFSFTIPANATSAVIQVNGVLDLSSSASDACQGNGFNVAMTITGQQLP